jgi:four helix bundle protein
MDLVLAVYHVMKQLPREEQYGLTSQVRRAAVAIPSNPADGHGRTGPREFAHHASIAYGSLCELETQLLLADRLGYTPPDESMDLAALTTEVRRLLRGLLRSLHGSMEPN